jgi:hypothetical protein
MTAQIIHLSDYRPRAAGREEGRGALPRSALPLLLSAWLAGLWLGWWWRA